MTDVTPIFDHYRVSARSIWNTAFWPDPELREWDYVDEFTSIERILFDSLDSRDFQYYRVQIAAFDEQPHLVGREALIERHYVRVLLADEPEA
jgi:hypothetical protein